MPTRPEPTSASCPSVPRQREDGTGELWRNGGEGGEGDGEPLGSGSTSAEVAWSPRELVGEAEGRQGRDTPKQKPSQIINWTALFEELKEVRRVQVSQRGWPRTGRAEKQPGHYLGCSGSPCPASEAPEQWAGCGGYLVRNGSALGHEAGGLGRE